MFCWKLWIPAFIWMPTPLFSSELQLAPAHTVWCGPLLGQCILLHIKNCFKSSQFKNMKERMALTAKCPRSRSSSFFFLTVCVFLEYHNPSESVGTKGFRAQGWVFSKHTPMNTRTQGFPVQLCGITMMIVNSESVYPSFMFHSLWQSYPSSVIPKPLVNSINWCNLTSAAQW